MTLSRAFTYKTFNPNTNDFDNDYKSFRKEVDKKTVKAINLLRFLARACVLLCGLCIIGAIAFGAFSDTGLWWCIPCAIGCCILLIGCIILGVKADAQADYLEEYFRDISFDDEVAECLRYNEEQEQIARAWRKEHPFEEKIRMAQTRGNSVDIAEMVKEYLKMQKGE